MAKPANAGCMIREVVEDPPWSFGSLFIFQFTLKPRGQRKVQRTDIEG